MVITLSLSAAIPMVKLKVEEAAVRKLLESLRRQQRSAKISNDRAYLIELFEREDELKEQLHALEGIYRLVSTTKREQQSSEQNSKDMHEARLLYEQYSKKYNT